MFFPTDPRNQNEMPARVETQKQKTRIILIGLDSADPDLVQRWCREGRLPFLNSLMQSGVYARLQSTQGLVSDSPWPTFHTGVNPAKHGYYNYIKLIRGTTEFRKVDARSCRYLPFWSLLRGANKKVAVFDVPKTYPLEGLDGLQISAWGEHYPMMRRCSLPPFPAWGTRRSLWRVSPAQGDRCSQKHVAGDENLLYPPDQY